MPGAISDSSVLIHLAAIGRFSLLDYYDSVIVPPAVRREVVVQGDARYGAAGVAAARDAGRIRIVSPRDRSLIRIPGQELHPGKAEGIVLLLELHPEILLPDGTGARQAALLHGLPVTGCVGILLRANADHRIRPLRAEPERLQRQGKIRLGRSFIQEILSRAGKKETS